MCNQYTHQQICLMNRIRQLWGQHVYWTRFFIISTAADLGDLEPVTKRLLQNSKDFAELLTSIFGVKAADQFEKLFTEHFLIAADLVNAAKNGEADKVNAARYRWYENAGEIAVFLSSINPCRNRSKWKSMLHGHFEMTEKEAILRLQGKYTADIEILTALKTRHSKWLTICFAELLKNVLGNGCFLRSS